MIRDLTLAAILVLTISSTALSQPLKPPDFRIGDLSIDGQCDSLRLVKLFGAPLRTRTKINDHSCFPPDTLHIFTFDSIRVAFGRNGTRWIEISSTSMATFRGIRVSDAAEKVRRKYGTPSTDDNWLAGVSDGDKEAMSYYQKGSTLGIAFYIRNGFVYRIILGWGNC